MTDCGAWTPPAGNDQLQILRILDCGDETLVIIRIHFDRELQRALAPPVAAAFEITHFASGAFIQFTMNIETAHTGVCADRCMLGTHRNHHIRTRVHVPRTHSRHAIRNASEQPVRFLAHIIETEPRAFDHRAGDNVILRCIALRYRQAFPWRACYVFSDARRVAQRCCKNSRRCDAGNTAAEVHHHQANCSPDRCIGAKAGTETTVAAVYADLLRIRAIDDHQRRDAMHGSLYAVHVEFIT